MDCALWSCALWRSPLRVRRHRLYAPSAVIAQSGWSAQNDAVVMSLSLQEAVRVFGDEVAKRFATGGGEPEDLLRGPFEGLLDRLADLSGIERVVPAGEHHMADERVRPDYAIYASGALTGFAELKAPGKGVEPGRYRGHDRQQWERLACLPNVLYSDGQSFALYRNGERVGSLVRLVGDVETAGAKLTLTDDTLLSLFGEFLRWAPIPPRKPKELALTAARLCRLLRAEVEELLVTDESLMSLAEDWRLLLFPEATDAEFADGYAQTVTFALLLARVEGIALDGRDLRSVADELGKRHTLMGRALDVLTSPAVLPKLAVSVQTLQRVLAVVDWSTLSKGDPAAWLYFYEDFLEGYDPVLRRATGSYYTPVEAVDPMVRMVDDLLRTRFGHAQGLGSAGVTVVDPGVGTGTFLFRIIERVASTIEEDEGSGAVAPRLREAASRLIGFEIQAGPYSVAELRLSTEFARRDAALGPKELRVYLTDTLANPYQAEEHLPTIYAPIALSRKTANEVKRNEPVVVVIGNPPYRERSKERGGWIEKGNPAAGQPAPLADFLPPKEWGLGAHVKHLYNPYVYFWRWASWKVFEHHPADKGIVAFITVAGFINGPGFAGMRAHLRRTADAIWVIDCSPEGHQPDVPTRVFPGVQQPICITIAARDGSTSSDEPAHVRFTSVRGRREDKFAALASLDLNGSGWADCPTAWAAPFLPELGASWASFPSLEELLAWSGSGTMPGRTWVISPSAKALCNRWDRLVAAPLTDKPMLLDEHPTDRTIHTRLSDNLPGYDPSERTLADETGACAAPVSYAYRSFDRQWIIPDKRVINRPNPSLWQIRSAPGQTYLTALHRASPSPGPALTATALIPDLDHYHGRGGRAWPLWLDSKGSQPNVVPGLLAYLETHFGSVVDAADLFAYLAALTTSPAFTARFSDDLAVPGLRIPLTAEAELFWEVAELGRRVLWLHTFGERFADPDAGRPAGRPPRAPEERRPKVSVTIPDTETEMPETIEYDPAARTLSIGRGRIVPVEPAVWDYEVSGMKVVKRWFDRRKRPPEGRRSSLLDDLVPSDWDSRWTTELLEMLNVFTLLVEIEPVQAELLERVLSMPLISVTNLTEAGVLPVASRPGAEKPPRTPRLFDLDAHHRAK